MFHRRSQPSIPVDGGDLASPWNNLDNDYRQLEDSAMPWYPQAPPMYEGTAKGDYELTAISGTSSMPATFTPAAEGDETSLLQRRKHDHPARDTRLKRLGRRFSGWRVGLLMSSVWTGAVLLLNLILTVWATQRFGMQDGYGTLIEGECSKTRKASTWIHLAINVLSTVLLSASNYCMQILTAPTRPEIDRAHVKGQWLDIGVPSVRNLKWISIKRVGIWGCLALSSLPLHLLYNSAVYDTLTSNEWDVYAGSKEVGAWSTISSNPAVIEFIQKGQRNELEALDPVACIRAYTPEFISERSHLALILDTNFTDNSIYRINKGLSWWLCSDAKYSPINCSPSNVIRDINNGEAWRFHASSTSYEPYPTIDGRIEYCLSQRVTERCQLQFSIKIMVIVIIANLLKLLCMLYTVRSHDVPTLVTMGDAVSSFLQVPDPTTVGYCTLSKRDVDKDGRWSQRVFNGSYQAVPAHPRPWIMKRHFWFSGASKTRWSICYFCCIATLITAGVLESIGQNAVSGAADIKSLWNLGFGAVTASSLIGFGGGYTNHLGLIGNILVANSAQVVLSFLYLSYNSIFTCQLLSREWTSYTTKRKPLRVTSPTGNQRSTYFLQLPYTYSLPLMAFSGVLHWLVSQSIFLARVNFYNGGDRPDPDLAISTCGYSCIAIICVLFAGSLLITLGFVNGFRRYPPGIPLAATCSVAISAACHPPADDTDAAFKDVQYGEVKTENGIRHCTFTSHVVTTPTVGELYA